jgi:predicted aconitase with swiveling domain
MGIMKTAEERAIKFAKRIIKIDCQDNKAVQKSDRLNQKSLAGKILILLKEQDKITKGSIIIDLNKKIAAGEMILCAYAMDIVSESKTL